MSMTVGQCRAARGLLGWSQAQLSAASHVSPASIANFESGKRKPIANNLAALQSALEQAGIIFIDQNGNGPGVRLRDRQG